MKDGGEEEAKQRRNQAERGRKKHQEANKIRRDYDKR